MTDRNVDILIATKVMGWTKIQSDGVSVFGMPPASIKNPHETLSGTGTGKFHVPRYTKKADLALEVLDTLDHAYVVVVRGAGKKWSVTIGNDAEDAVRSYGLPMPRAICLAAIAAVHELKS